ncbi:hypothetical protein GCM10011349_39250 [Novosphingobium indicum]|uniref:Uncharacterized protein n=1 Tax=Novosphingobium indicum TaxID=462949 RepID=A0ABQ2JXG0_9SPHN|nr:hypothetical protein GCM10011349_39250 [Novosphingobium indicum]
MRITCARWRRGPGGYHKGTAVSGKLVETIYGKRHRYEIRVSETFMARKFIIYRDGSRWKGDYVSLSRAVEVVRKDS